MRIAICNALYPTPEDPLIFGGAEVFVRELAENLVRRGNSVVVLRASLTGIRKTETVNGVTVEFIPVRNLYVPFQEKKNILVQLAWHAIDDNLRADSATRDVLAAFKPDIFHSNTLNGLSTDVWRTAKELGIPIVHTLHDYYLFCPRCSCFRHGQACSHTCHSCHLLTPNRRRRTDLVDRVTSVSQRTLQLHFDKGIFTKTRHSVIRNVANANISFSSQIPSEGPLLVGYLGRFSEEKGIKLLIDAIAQLPREKIRVSLAGRATENDRNFLRSRAPQADIEFLGFVTPADFYNKVQVVVVPSIWEEPGSLVLLDALAAGRPVIGTKFGGSPEMIEDNVTGWVVEPTPASLKAILSKLIDKPDMLVSAHRCLEAQRENTRDFSDMVDDYTAIYRSLSA
ncbi:glycosyltransferase [Rhizobium sp. rho-13.1]|uniref:glycosyltransferase family 4 protein n=1 Tax=Rhizobium sp. rho-13.1 TaxID=2506431 RepID=UPI0011607FDF|nr:glycosyltransferase family 4 protein [Rhizobium sp. rho-13.1]TQX85336.1 glycosyltransferase [Rhizobium sp. rho-13.1]